MHRSNQNLWRFGPKTIVEWGMLYCIILVLWYHLLPQRNTATFSAQARFITELSYCYHIPFIQLPYPFHIPFISLSYPNHIPTISLPYPFHIPFKPPPFSRGLIGDHITWHNFSGDCVVKKKEDSPIKDNSFQSIKTTSPFLFADFLFLSSAQEGFDIEKSIIPQFPFNPQNTFSPQSPSAIDLIHP